MDALREFHEIMHLGPSRKKELDDPPNEQDATALATPHRWRRARAIPNLVSQHYVQAIVEQLITTWAKHRVARWAPGADEGVVMADGRGRGSGLYQLYGPRGVAVHDGAPARGRHRHQ